jgi:hypothetical protein
MMQLYCSYTEETETEYLEIGHNRFVHDVVDTLSKNEVYVSGSGTSKPYPVQGS